MEGRVIGAQNGINTFDADAVAADIRVGKKAVVDNVLITGTIPTKSAATITPSTSNQSIASGQYLGGPQLISGDANLISANIKSGITIFGVAGNSNVVDTSAGDATPSQILSGKMAYVDGALVTGIIASKTSQTYTPTTSDQTIIAGQYLSGTQTISGSAYLVSGNIRAGVTIFGVSGNSNVVDTSGGDAIAAEILSGKLAYVDGALVTGTIPSKGIQTYTPTTSDQTITLGQYLSGDQTILGDADLVSANIKSGITIFGVAGNSNVVDTSAGDATPSQILYGKKAYVDGALVTGSISEKLAATITPGTSDQIITAGQYLSGAQTISGDADLISANIKKGVSIFGVNGDNNVVNTSDGDAVASNILNGKKAYVAGLLVTGTIPSKSAATITPSTVDQKIDLGQYLSGDQTISGDADLAAANIKKDISIFGVTGTYEMTIGHTTSPTIYEGTEYMSFSCAQAPKYVSFAATNNSNSFYNGVAAGHWCASSNKGVYIMTTSADAFLPYPFAISMTYSEGVCTLNFSGTYCNWPISITNLLCDVLYAY